jgi:thiol:disulfide interchange protein DsbA
MKALENSKQLHKNFFISYHEQGRTFPNVESILNFLESQGADVEKAKKIISSESVSKKVQEANYLLESYKIDSVPAIIINNKYRISGRMAKTYKRMIEISEYIIDLERASRIK